MNKKEILSQAMDYASTTKVLLCEPEALQSLPGIMNEYFPGRPVIPVADENTWEAAGKQTMELLRSFSIPVIENPFIFPGSPMLESDHAHACRLRDFYQDWPDGVPAAIGSGTINDLVKLSAHMADRPYISIATASSVDGYASDGAALLKGGSKRTFACPAPPVIIADTQLLAQAPPILAASGYADLVAKIPAGADWIIADRVGEAPIDRTSWDLVQRNLRTWLSDPKDNEGVFIGLTLCGIAMQYQKDSRPVSGAEHLLSHVWEMHHHTYQGQPILHGIKVGIATLITVAAMQWLLKTGCEGGNERRSFEQQMEDKQQLLAEQFSGLDGFEQMQRTLQEKYEPWERVVRRRELLKQHWEEIARSVSSQLSPYREVRDMLASMDCPIRAEDIGLEKSRAIATLRISQLIRNRYTILDVLDDLGMMERCIEELSDDPSVLS